MLNKPSLIVTEVPLTEEHKKKIITAIIAPLINRINITLIT